jgi:hypothetical protein
MFNSLDLSNNTALTKLDCSFNRINNIDVSYNTDLTYFDCSSNQITNLELTNNTELTILTCSYNKLSSLDLMNNTILTNLDCGNNLLNNLDLKSNITLTSVYCASNQLINLDLSNNTALTKLSCQGNLLSSLDLSNNTALNELYCSNNQLNNLNLSNTALTNLGKQFLGSCEKLESITIPKSVISLGQGIYGLFRNCENLKTITVEWPSPLEISEEVFAGFDKSQCALKVPAGTKQSYQSADVWKDFLNIEEYNPSSINSLIEDQPAIFPNPVPDILFITPAPHNQYETIEIYDLAGNRLLSVPYTSQLYVGNLPSGTYLLKLTTTTKHTHTFKFMKQ